MPSSRAVGRLLLAEQLPVEEVSMAALDHAESAAAGAGAELAAQYLAATGKGRRLLHQRHGLLLVKHVLQLL